MKLRRIIYCDTLYIITKNMILIADSGSTKTSWKLVNKGQTIKDFRTAGINPYYQTEEEIYSTISALQEIKDVKPEIFFYGAGCANIGKNTFVSNTLKSLFGDVTVFIASDMLGAARAVSGNNASIVAILGTGMNTCLYNGKDFKKNISPLGFILGDEGSGAYIGKIVVADYLREIMPIDLREKFFIQYEITKDIVLENTYKKPFPNRFLAGYTKFLFENKKHQYTKKVLKDSFNAFFERNIIYYENYKDLNLNIIGSIAYYFIDEIKEVAKEYNINIGNVMIEPIDGLVKYHCK